MFKKWRKEIKKIDLWKILNQTDTGFLSWDEHSAKSAILQADVAEFFSTKLLYAVIALAISNIAMIEESKKGRRHG